MSTTFNTTTNLPVTLEEFKAHVVDTSGHRDAEMLRYINAAVRAFEMSFGVSFSDHDITFVSTSKLAYKELLYGPIESISSVTDLKGNDLSYDTELEPISITLNTASQVKVVYKTKSSIDEAAKQAIMDYAALLYNGSTDQKEFGNEIRKYNNKVM